MPEKASYEELEQRIQELEQAESECKGTEKALRESERRFRRLVEHSTDAFFLHERDGRIMDVNDHACESLGYTREELLALSIRDIDQDFIPGSHTESWEQMVQGVPITLEGVHRRKDGTTFPVEIRLACFESGEDQLMLGLVRDVTERKRREEALRESEEKYQELAESISDVFFAMDKDLRYIYWNKASEVLTGIPAEEAVGKSLMELFPDNESLEQLKILYLSVIETKKPAQSIVQYRDNEQIVHEINAYPTIEGVSVFVKDITERKKAEEELLRAQKLESLGILAGGIAHDFNNILTTILGNVSMARMQVAPEGEPFEMLSEAETASIRAQKLTKQLLTFAKGGAPVKETTSIKDILKESPSFVLRGSKSRCEFSIAEDLWPAEIDVGQISQVINNIVINANQAMPEGGIIQVAAENLIINAGHGLPVNPGRYIRISIKDQGVGIAEKHLKSIFDPYFTTKHDGSGLGLATTYSIIEKHEGHITVESRLGAGTTFHIYLPASDKAVLENEEVRLIKGQGRILVMDDEAPLRKMLGRMLKNLDYESEFAKDGAEALRMYKDAQESETPYDVVILDLTIPGGMGGTETIKKLLEVDPEVKAIVYSGYSDDPVLSNFQEYGFKGMMPKPFESQSLSKVLHEVLKGEKE